jgi:hypothetical protein
MDFKIVKDKKSGYKTAMTMRLYQVIIEKPDKSIFIARLNLQVI